MPLKLFIANQEQHEHPPKQFFASRDESMGAGWFVFAKAPEHGDRTLQVCVRPDSSSKNPKTDCAQNYRGFRSKWMAEKVAAHLNGHSMVPGLTIAPEPKRS